MRVLVYGATGYIGLPTARAFVRAGHIVFGQTRSPDKAKRLAAEEIQPVVTDVTNTACTNALLSNMDVVIDLVSADEGALESVTHRVRSVTAEAVQANRPPHAPKLTFIGTSGTWVHGNSRTDIVTDSSPVVRPLDIIQWRTDYEQRVINDPRFNGIIVRPSLTYGRSGSVVGRMLFEKAAKGRVEWPGTRGLRVALCHVDDVAEMYLLAAEKGAIVGGNIFDVANGATESMDAILERLVEVSGAEGPYSYVEPANAMEAGLNTSIVLRPYLARTLLGWQPRKPSLLDNMDVYYKAWKASKELLSEE